MKMADQYYDTAMPSEDFTGMRTLISYQRQVLAMRKSVCIDFPAHVHLETLSLCNAACSFCPYPTLDRKGGAMDDALIAKLLRDLEDIPRQHRFQLSPFKVNEPFLDKRLFDILDQIRTRLPNALITLISNASPITEKTIVRLAALGPVPYLWISFNDHREAEYEAVMKLPYRRTIERLDMLHRARSEGRLGMRIVLSRVADETPADAEFVRWVAVTYPLFESYLIARGSWVGKVDQPGLRVPEVGCIRWFELSVTSTGVVAHCCMDGNADYPIGDARQDHLLDIYNRPDYRRLRETVFRRSEVAPCSGCSFF